MSFGKAAAVAHIEKDTGNVRKHGETQRSHKSVTDNGDKRGNRAARTQP